MPTEEEIENVRRIMEESEVYATSEEEKQKLKELLEKFDSAASRYLGKKDSNVKSMEKS